LRGATRAARCEEGGWVRRFVADSILEVDLLKKKEGACLVERGEGAVELQV
jgi:hypothetical protein